MRIRVKAHPSAKKDKLIALDDDLAFEVWVRAKPLDGAANTAVRQLLSRHFALPLTHIRLIRGAQSRNKWFEIIDSQ